MPERTEYRYRVPADADGLLLQDYFQNRLGFSRRMVIDLKKGGLSVNGEHRRMVDPVAAGDEILLRLGEEEQPNLIPNPDLPVSILYEDRDLTAMVKPAGMSVHPCTLYYNDTVGNWFAAHYQDGDGGIAFRPLYRLDRDTTGIVVAAKNTLSAGMLMGHLEKVYYAVAEGIVEEESGTIDAPLIRVPGSIITRKVDFERADAQRAVTHFRVLERGNGHTLLSFRLETGRTHQIRVHMAYIGHPLAGDTLYGGHDTQIQTQALHCGEVTIPAVTALEREEMTLRLPLPEQMARLIR
jgi:23S rRNA pseudouridine1911/1915/1917 synthase